MKFLAALSLVFAAASASATTWGPETNLSATPTDSETGLNHRPLVFDANGTLHVVWAEKDAPNANYRIYARDFTSGAWGAPVLVVDYLATDPGSNGGAKYPALAASPNGDLDLFWHDYRIDGIDNLEIFTKHRAAGAAWDPSRAADVRLTATEHPESNGDNGYVPTAAVSGDGALHVLWYDFRFDGNAAEIFSKTRPAGGAWNLAPGDSADRRVSSDGDQSELPACAVDAGGTIHAAWRSAGSGARILYARSDAGSGAWSAPIPVDGAGMVAGAPALSVDGAERVHVIWPDSRDGGRALFTRVREPSGTWSPVARITRPAEAADEPSLTTGDDGSLHLVWHDARVSLFNREVIYRAKPIIAPWDSSGASDIRISNATGNSGRPSVAARGGSIAILWKDARDGNNEIYARLGSEAASASPALPAPSASLLALRAVPNPARGGLTHLVAAGSGSAAIGAVTLVDARGRVVRRLFAAGRELFWDGRDGAGTPVPAGVYFARRAGGETEATSARASIVVLR